MPRTPTISVRGVGHVSVPPDRTVISFSISTLDMEYARSANDLNERVAKLRSRLEESGLDPADLKTASYSVDARHEWRGKDENRRCRGYQPLPMTNFTRSFSRPAGELAHCV